MDLRTSAADCLSLVKEERSLEMSQLTTETEIVRSVVATAVYLFSLLPAVTVRATLLIFAHGRTEGNRFFTRNRSG
jgi:hypothetical protein